MSDTINICTDCREHMCDDCYENDCQCNLSNHSYTTTCLVRSALDLADSDSVYILTAQPQIGPKSSQVDISVNGNVFRVTVKTLKLGPEQSK